MSAAEVVAWSMALGAIAAVAFARLAGLLTEPSVSHGRAVAYHATAFTFVLLLSGVGTQLWPSFNGWSLHYARVLAGPVCVGLSNFWIRDWLSAAQRDGLTATILRGSSLLSPLVGLACFALPVQQQLPAAAIASLVGASLTLWLTVRAWLMGDRLAPFMAAGTLLMLVAVAALHWVAMNLKLANTATAIAALASALGSGLCGFALWRRHRHEWKNAHRERAARGGRDPVTHLRTGVALVQRLIDAQERRRRTGRNGAALAVMVFDVERVEDQLGVAAVNQMFICIASRIQQQVGVVNPVGRYWDRCFIVLVETIHSAAWLRTLGLRVASELRKPIEVSLRPGQSAQIHADIGVGVVHLDAGVESVDDVLHEAQRLASAARQMRSRAAIRDPVTASVMPVEQAQLGD